MKNQEFDFCYVVLPVEFLPGKILHATLSLEFADKEIADKSLKHFQKTFPDANLAFMSSNYDSEDEDYQGHLEMVIKRDKHFRQAFIQGV